jgi:enoyl-CoA hydratase/carnithine racemase
MAAPALRELSLAVDGAIATVTLRRPRAANALTSAMLNELSTVFAFLETHATVRAVVLAGEGRHFCAGIDLAALAELLAEARAAGACPGRQRLTLLKRIVAFQDAISSLERYSWPVVCAIHGACVGGGIDLITAADVRFSTRDAQLCVKEVDLAITADLGTLQRLPLIVGEGRARELALTCRTFSGAEALQMGLVSACFDDAAATLHAATDAALSLAHKSPLATTGTKAVMRARYAASVAEGLERVALRNAATLMSLDIEECMRAQAERRPPVFARL